MTESGKELQSRERIKLNRNEWQPPMPPPLPPLDVHLFDTSPDNPEPYQYFESSEGQLKQVNHRKEPEQLSEEISRNSGADGKYLYKNIFTSPDNLEHCQYFESTEGHVKHVNHGNGQEKLSVEKISRNSGAGGSYRYQNIFTSSDNLEHCQNIESTEIHVNHVFNHRKEQEPLSVGKISRNSGAGGSYRYENIFTSSDNLEHCQNIESTESHVNHVFNHRKEPEPLPVEKISRNSRVRGSYRYENIFTSSDNLEHCQIIKSTEIHVNHVFNHRKEPEQLPVDEISRNSGAGGSYRYENIFTSSDNLEHCQNIKSTEIHVNHVFNHRKEPEPLSVEKISRNSGARGSYRYENIFTSSDNLDHCQNIESTESHVNHVFNHRKEQELLSVKEISCNSGDEGRSRCKNAFALSDNPEQILNSYLKNSILSLNVPILHQRVGIEHLSTLAIKHVDHGKEPEPLSVEEVSRNLGAGVRYNNINPAPPPPDNLD